MSDDSKENKPAPKQGYYPSAKVKLTVRFEDFVRVTTDGSKAAKPGKGQAKVGATTPSAGGKAPAKQVRNLKGIVVPRAELVVVSEPSPDGGSRFVLKGLVDAKGTLVKPGDETASRPTAPRDSLPSNTAAVLGIIPHQASLKKNSPRIADTLSLTIRWEDFPINPIAIRATAVEFYLGTVSDSDYAKGMLGGTRQSKTPGDLASIEPLHMVPDSYVSPEDKQTYSNMRFQGWVDKCDVEFNEGVPFVKFECTDNTRLLMDQSAPPNVRFNPNKPVEEAIADYLSHFPQFEGLTIQYYPEEEAGTVTLKKALAKPLFPPALGPAPSGGGEEMSVMDYLVQIVGTLAHTIRVEGTNVVIQKSNSLVGGKRRKRPGDSYVTRVVDKNTFINRAIVYGWNASSVKYARNFSGRAPKNMEVRSYTPGKKAPTVGRYPQKGDRIISPLPGGKEENKWNVQTIAQGLSQDQVNQAAKQAYEATARTELQVSVKTKNLASYGGGNDNPDLLDLVTGDPIDIYIDKNEASSSIAATDAAMQVAAACEQKMLALGFSKQWAQLYAKARSNTAMPRTYYTREIGINWSVDSGIDIDIEAVNYIEARLEGSDDKNS